MMAELIAGILGLIRKKNFTEAKEIIDRSYQNFLKNDASFFQRIPKEKLTEELLEKHNYTRGHLQILAELFFAEAEVLYAREFKKEALQYYEKSLLLFNYVLKETKTFSLEEQNRISSIQQKIDELNSK